MDIAGTGGNRETRTSLSICEFCRGTTFYESRGRARRGGRPSPSHPHGVGPRDGDALDPQDSRSASQRLHHGGEGRFARAIAISCCAPTKIENAMKIKIG